MNAAPPAMNHPAFARLIDALAGHLVQQHLTAKPAPDKEKPDDRSNRGAVAERARAA
jgi:hypothetical protein